MKSDLNYVKQGIAYIGLAQIKWKFTSQPSV